MVPSTRLCRVSAIAKQTQNLKLCNVSFEKTALQILHSLDNLVSCWNCANKSLCLNFAVMFNSHCMSSVVNSNITKLLWCYFMLVESIIFAQKPIKCKLEASKHIILSDFASSKVDCKNRNPSKAFATSFFQHSKVPFHGGNTSPWSRTSEGRRRALYGSTKESRGHL